MLSSTSISYNSPMNTAEAKQLLENLISTPSFDPSKSTLPDVVISWFKSRGIDIQVLESNGIRNLVAKTPGEAKLILNGHWDTVLTDPKFAKLKQIPLKSDSKIIHGLGAC